MIYEYHNLTLWLFSEINATGKVTLLYTGPEKEFSIAEIDNLQVLWMKILYEFIDALDDKETKDNLELLHGIIEMEYNYKVINNALNLWLSDTSGADKKTLVKILAKQGQVLNHKKNTEPQVKKIVKHLKILKTNIQNKKLENKKLFEENTEKAKNTVYKDTLMLGRVLDMKFNPRETVLPEWVEAIKLGASIINQKKTA